MRPTARDVLISVDVEADGPIPGQGSLTSLGSCICATRDAQGAIEVLDPRSETFYGALRPDCEVWDPAALAVSGLDRDALLRDGADPTVALGAFADWVDELGARFGGTPVFCAFPLGYDWLWVYT